MSESEVEEQIEMPDAPAISGLRFRGWAGHSDYPRMAAVFAACREADGADWAVSAEELAQTYTSLPGCEPSRDLLLVEIDGNVVGYKMVRCSAEEDGTGIYGHAGWIIPAWRARGLGRAMVRHSEAQLRRRAAAQPAGGARFFQAGAGDRAPDRQALLSAEGYTPVRYMYSMVRPMEGEIQDAPLPAGLEVRPVEAEHYRAIWAAEREAFRDHWGTVAADLADFDRWLAQPFFQPDLWQVAWDGDQVVGMVRNFISEEENAAFTRLRGYTEEISVRRPWRRRGVARALLARSIRLHRDRGMTETALGVDTENPNGALRLYESVGYRVVRCYTVYRKPL